MVIFCSAHEFDSLCRDLCGKAEVVRLQAKGGSMHPFVQSGDDVHVELWGGSTGDIHKGDIILFRREDGLYLHRVLKRQGHGFLVKADMAIGTDGIISLEDVLGRVKAVERRGRRIDLSTPANRFVSAMIAVSSLFMQYPLFFARTVAALGIAAVIRIQSLLLFRRIIKKIGFGNMAVRDAGPEDEEQLRDLYLMAGHDIREGLGRVKKEGMWLVAESNKRIIAGLTMTRHEKDPGLWLIFGLEVKPLCRGRGAGSCLVKEALARAKASGAHSVGLFVDRNARPAVMLYHKLGFKSEDIIPAGFNRSSSDLYLACQTDGKP